MSDKMVMLDLTRAGIAVVTLNRPEVHNALNAEVIEQLSAIFLDLSKADGVRAVLIEGAGKSFSAGADIKWMRAAADYTYQDNLVDARALAHMLHQLYTLPQPTIALVDGAARGGGVGMIAACDMAVACRAATFAFSEVSLGLTPSTISPYVLKAIGERAARRYFLTGETFDAGQALQMGLVHHVVNDKNELAEQSEYLVQKILENGPAAIAGAKDLIAAVAGCAIDHALMEETARRIADQRATPEAIEGLDAFLNKRKAKWSI